MLAPAGVSLTFGFPLEGATFGGPLLGFVGRGGMKIDESDVEIGDRVCVKTGMGPRWGYIRYKGPVAFAEGYWLGMECDEPLGSQGGIGKDGLAYFTCRSNHGRFIRPDSIISRVAPLKSPPPSTPGRTPGRRKGSKTPTENRDDNLEDKYLMKITGIHPSCPTNELHLKLRAPGSSLKAARKISAKAGDTLNEEIQIDGWGSKGILQLSLWDRKPSGLVHCIGS